MCGELCVSINSVSGKRIFQMGLVILVSLVLLYIGGSQVVQVVGEFDLDTGRVTLKTLDAGTFIGQRVVSEAIAHDPNELPKFYFAFRGIPYSLPPLRWGPPIPPEVRKQPRVATDFKPICSQWDWEKKKVVGNPDCLYLNIFSPYVPSSVSKKKLGENYNASSQWTVENNKNLLPVLVYFHGGEFISGSANQFGEKRFMNEKNVVLITLNFRLGLPGFFSKSDESLQGNYGLLDQIEALRWIQQNVYRFGGNPLRVCIFGSVEYLLMAKGTKGLFQSAIITQHSTSSPFSPSLVKADEKEKLREMFQMVAKEAGCPTNDDSGTLQCLQITETESLIRIQHRLTKFFSYPTKFKPGPTSDEFASFPIILSLFSDEIQSYPLLNVPVMIGLSAYEGFEPFFEFYLKLGPNRGEKIKDREFLRERLSSALQIILGIDIGNKNDLEFSRIFGSIWNFYFGSFDSKWEAQDGERIVWKIFRIFGDLTYNSGHSKLAQFLARKSNKASVYNYIFNTSIQNFHEYLENRLEASTTSSNMTFSFHKSLHSSHIPPWKELNFLFNDPSDENKVLSEDQQRISDFLVKLWVNFANYGSPKHGLNISSKNRIQIEGKWTKAGGESGSPLNYFVLGEKAYPLRGDFRKAETRFWLSILPQIRDLSEQIKELEPFPLLLYIFVGLTTFLVIISVVLIIYIFYSSSSCCRGGDRGHKYYYQ